MTRLRPHAERRPSRRVVIIAVRALVVLLAAVLATPTPAQADEIRFGHEAIPIGGVRIRDIENGQITYTSNTGQTIKRPWAPEVAVFLDAYPDLASAQRMLDQGYTRLERRPDSAVSFLERGVNQLVNLRPQVRETWLGYHIDGKILAVAQHTNQLQAAVDAFLRLAEADQQAFLVLTPEPLITAAADQAKADVARTIQRRLPQIPEGPSRTAVRRLLDLAQGREPTSAAPTPDTTGPGIGGLSRRVIPSEIPVTNRMPADDAVAALIRDAKFEQAMQQLQPLINAERFDSRALAERPMRLYQLGLCQLYLAESRGSADQIKDAGLTFARIVFHYPGSYQAPALLELGYVHQRLGRTELAMRLYDRVRQQLDEEREPALTARCTQLIEQVRRQAGSN